MGNNLDRKRDRIVLDLEELAEEDYLNYEARDEIKKIVKQLKEIYVYSTEV